MPIAKDARKRAHGRFFEHVRSQRDAQIVTKAADVLISKGCRAFRVDHVTAACGIAKGTCYQHFHSQTDLIAAAVRHLDEGLAGRLLSPPSNLTQPRQRLEWAVLQAADAQTMTVTHRSRRKQAGAALDGNPWPCCLGALPCPYGASAGRSHRTLLHWANDLLPSSRVPRSLYVALLLAVVPTLCLGLDRQDKLPHPPLVRSMVHRLFTHFFPLER